MRVKVPVDRGNPVDSIVHQVTPHQRQGNASGSKACARLGDEICVGTPRGRCLPAPPPAAAPKTTRQCAAHHSATTGCSRITARIQLEPFQLDLVENGFIFRTCCGLESDRCCKCKGRTHPHCACVRCCPLYVVPFSHTSANAAVVHDERRSARPTALAHLAGNDG